MYTAGNAGIGQRAVTRAGVLVVLDDHRDVASLERLTVERRAVGQQGTDVGGEVGADVLSEVIDGDVLSSLRPNVARDTTRNRKGSLCGAPASRLPR